MTNNEFNELKAKNIEPYLVEFEAELLQSSKSEIIKDLSNMKTKLGKSSPKQQPPTTTNKNGSHHNGEHIFKKYLNDLRNLTVGRKSSTNLSISCQDDEEEMSSHMNRRVRHHNDDDDDEDEKHHHHHHHDDDDEDELLNEEDEDELEHIHDDDDIFNSSTKKEIVEEKLRTLTKSHIPWQNLDPKSAQLLVSSYLDKTSIEMLPSFYSRKGNKISSNQVSFNILCY